jgi:hypothetical protein
MAKEFQGCHLVERSQFHSYHDSHHCWLHIARAMTPADRDGHLPGAGQSLVAGQFRVRWRTSHTLFQLIENGFYDE